MTSSSSASTPVFRGFGRIDELFAGLSAQPVEADAPGDLRDPGPERIVIPQCAQPLVDPQEHLLERILGVVLGEAEALDGDCVHVAGEALDELVPGFVVAGPAPRDQLGVAHCRLRLDRSHDVPSTARRADCVAVSSVRPI